MEVNISGHHVVLTDAIKAHVEKRVKRIERHFDHISRIDIVLEVEEKYDHKAEATAHGLNTPIFAESHDEDMYKAIDSLVDKLDRQIIKYKEKLTDHHPHHGGMRKTRGR